VKLCAVIKVSILLLFIGTLSTHEFVTRSDHIQRLFENIVRLRRAERELPGNRDLLAVRTQLEDELGPTVSRSQAARLLGLSHTALQRWQKAGDLPLVISPSGRTEVPVAALVRLYDAVEAERRSGRRRRHTLEPVFTEGRRRAEQLDAKRLIWREPEDVPEPGHLDRHELPQLRSLAYHRALAKRLRRPMVDASLQLLRQWREAGKIDPEYASRWEEVLRRPIPQIREVLEADSQDARDLRQNSPFVGMLSEPERRKILDSVR